MADNVDPGPGESAAGEGRQDEPAEQMRPVVTRREFMAGAGAGLAVGAVVAGGIAVASRSQTQPGTEVVTAPGAPAAVVAQPAAPAAPAQAQAQPTAQPAQAKPVLPLNMRQVELNIDG